MKEKINRIMVVCMLIGFCAIPSISKSQSIQVMRASSFSLNSDLQSNFNSWFGFNNFFDCDWSSDEEEVVKVDSLKQTLDLKSKDKSSIDSIIPKIKRNTLKKTGKKNFRNMPVVIQTRI